MYVLSTRLCISLNTTIYIISRGTVSVSKSSVELSKSHSLCGCWWDFLTCPLTTERSALDRNGGCGWKNGIRQSKYALPWGKTNLGPGNLSGKSTFDELEANVRGGKRLLLLFIPPPPSFVNCQIISAFTFPWENLGLLIMPLPVMKAIERLSQVRHQMADCFAQHKCYKTANSEVPVML